MRKITIEIDEHTSDFDFLIFQILTEKVELDRIVDQKNDVHSRMIRNKMSTKTLSRLSEIRDGLSSANKTLSPRSTVAIKDI